jgi:hypothetical protein
MAILTTTSADAGKTIPLAGGISWSVTGDDSVNTFEVAVGAAATINGGGGADVIKFLGSSSDYTVALNGTNAVFTSGSSVVTIPVNTFGGGNADYVQFGTGTPVLLSSTGSTVTLGAQTIAASAAAVTGATGTAASGGTPAGQTFTLTTGADNIVGTSSDDTVAGSVVFIFNGVANVVDTTSTYTVADTVNLGAGTADTFNLVASGGQAGPALALPTGWVTGTEVLNIRNASANEVTLDASTVAGLTGIYADRSSSTVTLTNVANSATVGIKGNGTLVTGDFNFGYKTDTAAISLAIADGVTAGNITGDATGVNDAATTATITSTGLANVVGIVDLLNGTSTLTSLTINATTNLTGRIAAELEGDFAANSTLTVKGAATTVYFDGDLANAITTVDASGMTSGGLNAILGTGAATVKGGAGVDLIYLNTGVKVADLGAGDDVVVTNNVTVTATAAGAITGGTGTDTLAVTNATDVSTSAKKAVFTSFENLENATSGSIAADGFTGITKLITVSPSGGFIGMTAAQATSVDVKVELFSQATTYALTTPAGTSDVLGLNIADPSDITNNFDADQLTVDDFETVNFTVGSGVSGLYDSAGTAYVAATNYTLLDFASAVNLKTVTLAGAYPAAIYTTGLATVTTVNASANKAGAEIATSGNTGTLTVTGTGARDIILMGAAGAGGSTIVNAGAGDDKISAAQADVAVALINGGTGIDTLALTDNGGGATVSIADNSFTGVTGIEKLTTAAVVGLNFAVGGYANAIATSNGGVLDITAASLNVVAGGVAVDATGLSVGNSLKLSLTNASTAGPGTIAVTLSQGADNISIAQAVASSGDAITIDGGVSALASTTAKTIDLSLVTTGLSTTVTTGAGADIIKSAGIASTITAGKGGDTITLLLVHGGAQTLATASDATGTATATAGALTASTAIGASTLSFATTGMDIITNFATGDKVQLYTTGTTAIVTSNVLLTGASTLGASTVGDVAIVKGAYNSGVFTASTTGTDSALIWDSNGATTGGTYSAIVLVGYVDGGTPDTISTAGLFTGVA